MQKKTIAVSLSLLLTFLVFTFSGAAYAQESGKGQELDQLYRDDFYTAVNREWLDTTVIPEGYNFISAYTELEILTTRQVEDMIRDLLLTDHPKGSNEQKITDFHRAYMDVDSRNAMGITPILPYLTAVEEAKTIGDLMKANQLYFEEAGSQLFWEFSFSPYSRDNTVYMLYVNSFPLLFSVEMLQEENVVKAYVDYVATLFALSGSSAEAARADAEEVVAFERDLAAYYLTRQEKSTQGSAYRYVFDEFCALYPEIDMASIVTGIGLELPDELVVNDGAYHLNAASFFTDEHLDILKLYAKRRILSGNDSALSLDFLEAADAFGTALSGIQGNQPLSERVAGYIKGFMPDLLEELYIDRYFDQEIKADVTKMVYDILTVYKEMLSANDWLSPATKERALNKLETMDVKVGCPDVWPNYLQDIVISTYQDGGNCVSNLNAISRAYTTANLKRQGKPVDRSYWRIFVYQANAIYSPQRNEITIPAAVLQPPIYDLKASFSANLGSIGTLIAHEISHAFDTDGAQYDESGNWNNWWTEEDEAAFQEKCSRVSAFYDGIEIIPGVYSNGPLTVDENVADLGAVKCALQVLKKREHPDYQAFFLSLAAAERGFGPDQFIRFVTAQDPHSFFNIRLNRLVVNFQEFYDTFSIKEGDGMYVPPEERVSVW